MPGPRIWFDPPLFQWRRVLVTAAVVGAFVLGWQANERGLWRDTPLPPIATASTAVPAAPASVGAPVQRPAAAARPLARVTPAQAPASAPPGPGEVEVCGAGIVKAASGTDALELAMKARSTGVRAAWQAALLGSADVRTRAAGIRVAGGADVHDRLARLAADSRDPLVYALAMSTCQPMMRASNPGACQLLSPEQWVTIDPDNASPWLHLADAAIARRTDSSEAFHRAAQAKYVRSYWGALNGLVLGAQPPGASALDRLAMAVEATNASPVTAPLAPASAFCAATVLRDVNRRQTCDALATLLVDRGDTVADLTIGRALGERLGWPPERIAALRDERDALMALQRERVDAEQGFGCSALDRQTAYFGDLGRRGELGALRDALKRSGRSADSLARGWRAASAPRS